MKKNYYMSLLLVTFLFWGVVSKGGNGINRVLASSSVELNHNWGKLSISDKVAFKVLYVYDGNGGNSYCLRVGNSKMGNFKICYSNAIGVSEGDIVYITMENELTYYYYSTWRTIESIEGNKAPISVVWTSF